MATTGQRIKQLREQSGCTREELAARLGVSKVMVYYLEAGKRKLSNELLVILADVFNCTTDFLLCRDNDVNKNAERIWR